MRPVRLEVEGLTSFREKAVLDFDGLDLFAITGPTGAGKSSLIDALTFALFGQVPRVGREYKLLIAHGAERLSVSLEFEVGTQRYRVARTVRGRGAAQVRLEKVGPSGPEPLAPNATVIVIEHAERYGLAQLHQLRGRVGRGAHQSLCILMATYLAREARTRVSRDGRPEQNASNAQQRLAALVNSNDGFVIAEEDLRIRGPGEFLGLRQWGVPEFRAANLMRDAQLLEQARQEAVTLLEQDPGLTLPQHQAFKAAMLRRWRGKLALGDVS